MPIELNPNLRLRRHVGVDQIEGWQSLWVVHRTALFCELRMIASIQSVPNALLLHLRAISSKDKSDGTTKELTQDMFRLADDEANGTQLQPNVR
jgi:hypothetical protein